MHTFQVLRIFAWIETSELLVSIAEDWRRKQKFSFAVKYHKGKLKIEKNIN